MVAGSSPVSVAFEKPCFPREFRAFFLREGISKDHCLVAQVVAQNRLLGELPRLPVALKEHWPAFLPLQRCLSQTDECRYWQSIQAWNGEQALEPLAVALLP